MSQTIREQALAETKIVATAQTSATDAQTTGMLVLKDPRPEILTRSWQYFAGFTAQNFQPEGKATNTTTTFDLGENGSTFMPGLTLGVMGPEWNLKSVLISVGVRGDASFASQSVSAVLPSGFTEEARLNTTLMSAGPALNLRWEGLRWLGLTFTPQFGSLNYTQTSSNDFAHFSKRAAYTAMAYGLDFRLTRKWSVFTEWSQRSLNDSNQEIALQKDNFELGTKVSW
ncbi:MAG: hypothetical protein J7501_11000 [Bdellovibrio sp.]|nr:hypothetical protein [Bdellovibrio sp.]